MPRRFLSLRAIGYVVCLAVGLGLSAAVSARSESEIKAFYLFNFIKFITWPDEPTSADLNICVAGANPFSSLEDKLNSLTARSRKIQMLNAEDGPLSECSILFISESESNFYETLIEPLNGFPILTISDIDGFMEHGGMIGFIKVGNVVRFEISLKNTRSAGLEMSAKLLELAIRVEQ